MHAQQAQVQQTVPRTIQAQVAAYNEAVDHLLYHQQQAQYLQRLLIEHGVPLVTDSNNPHHVQLARQAS